MTTRPRVAALASRAQYPYLGIPAASFFSRELHDVVGFNSGYGWGTAVLNGHLEARDFWRPGNERQHIIWKELKAVRLAVESFVSHFACRRVLLLKDNHAHAVCNVLDGRTSRSLELMTELRQLCYLLDINGIHVRARYIRSVANVWADRMSRHLDSDDWHLYPVLFAELEAEWGPTPSTASRRP
eukprot:jgi/Tetstr1/424168/TSEL_014774.t1